MMQFYASQNIKIQMYQYLIVIPITGNVRMGGKKSSLFRFTSPRLADVELRYKKRKFRLIFIKAGAQTQISSRQCSGSQSFF